MPELPTHLSLPLISSILLVSGFILIKNTTTRGVSPWSVTFIANQWAAIAFSFIWFFGGPGQSPSLLWQPAVIAILYISGQVFTFLAISRGDVSVATPVLGVKVIIVPFLVTLILHEELPKAVWFATAMSAVGIAMVQWTGRHPNGRPAKDGDTNGRHRISVTIAFAVMAACSFSFFDVFVQKWAPAWGAGRLLPTVYWFVAIFSLAFLPAIRRDVKSGVLLARINRLPLAFGTLLIAIQAICIVLALSNFGDAARVNVVYSLRSLWGVLFAWAAAIKWGGNEADLPIQVMLSRLCGAMLLTLAVAIAILGPRIR